MWTVQIVFVMLVHYRGKQVSNKDQTAATEVGKDLFSICQKQLYPQHQRMAPVKLLLFNFFYLVSTGHTDSRSWSLPELYTW